MNNDLRQRINSNLKTIKTKRNKNRDLLFCNIATDIKHLFLLENKSDFLRSDILSLIPIKKFSLSTRQDYTKSILNKMCLMGFCVESKKEKCVLRVRRYILKSNDYGSYKLMMNKNGFNKIDYFVFVMNKEGFPQKKKVGESGINEIPKDLNGEVLNDWDISILRETKPTEKQGVYSFGNKSLSFEQRIYNINSYMFCDSENE